MGVILAGLVAGVVGIGAVERGQPAAGKVLIVADDWGPMAVLGEYLVREGRYEVEKADQKELTEALGGYRAVVMYLHGRMTARTEKVLVAYAEGGGRLVIVHHGIASARWANPLWLKLTGIYMAGRTDKERPWKVIGETRHTLVNLQPGHYITSHKVRWEREVEYESSDYPSRAVRYPAMDLEGMEVFLNQQFTDGRAKTVLLGFDCVDPETGARYRQDRSGWYKRAKKGWVFYFQAGHAARDFAKASYSQMILNSIQWRDVR